MKNFFIMILALIGLILLSPFAFIGNLIWRWKNISQYFYTIAIGIDQLGGSLIYNKENWTISGYTYHKAVNKNELAAKILLAIIDFIFYKGHCEDAYKQDLEYTAKEEL